jgi:hypothetical protein
MPRLCCWPSRSKRSGERGDLGGVDGVRSVRAVDDGWGPELWRPGLRHDERGTEMTSMTSTELVPGEDIFSHGERMALLGFLATYRGATREASASDLRQFST